MDSIHKPKALGLLRVLARVGRITQQARRHAWPEGEDDKSEQVAHCHGPPPPLKDGRSEGRRKVPPVLKLRFPSALFLHLVSWPRGRDVIQHDEVEDRAGNVYERVRLVCPPHERGPLEEPLLHSGLNEDAQSLFQPDNLEPMLAGGVDGVFLERYGSEGSSELVYLAGVNKRFAWGARARDKEEEGEWATHPVDKSPVPNLGEERKSLEHPTQKAVLEDVGVGRLHFLFPAHEAQLPCLPF